MKPLSDQQRLFMVDSIQLYEAWQAAAMQVRAHRYGMKWLKSGSAEYLVRLTDAKGNGNSLSAQIDRDPLKKQRDLHQADVIFEANKDHLPQYEIRPDDLKCLPKEVVQNWIGDHQTSRRR